MTTPPNDAPDRQELDDLHRWVMRGVRTLSDPGATIADAPHSTGRSPQ